MGLDARCGSYLLIGGVRMKQRFAIVSLGVMVATFIIGIILIFSSVSIGQRKGFEAMQRNGGHMDTSRYHMIIEANTSSYRTGGLALALVGGFGTLLSGYAVYQKLD